MITVSEYVELWTTFDGAFDDAWVVETPKRFAEVIREVSSAALAFPGEVCLYRILHFHGPEFEGECECIQYETDLRPLRTWRAPQAVR